jgi:raffinose/stachyose/melibiose transport system permease protein
MSEDRPLVGLANYIKIFQDPVSLLALKNNLVWTLVMLAVPTTLGLLLALGLNRNIRGKTLFRSFFYSPAILPLVGVAGIWSWMFDPNVGLINTTLRKVGLDVLAHQWLGDPGTALYAVMVAGIWQGVGFPMVLYLAGLQRASPASSTRPPASMAPGRCASSGTSRCRGWWRRTSSSSPSPSSPRSRCST